MLGTQSLNISATWTSPFRQLCWDDIWGQVVGLRRVFISFQENIFFLVFETQRFRKRMYFSSENGLVCLSSVTAFINVETTENMNMISRVTHQF